MSTDYEQPLSRRAAREAAERAARDGAVGSRRASRPSAPPAAPSSQAPSSQSAPEHDEPTPDEPIHNEPIHDEPIHDEPAHSAPSTPSVSEPSSVHSAPRAPHSEPAQRVRRRDFRPPAEQQSPRSTFAPVVDEDAPLDYRTERPAYTASQRDATGHTPSPLQQPDPHVTGERTISRRELRARREGRQAEAPAPRSEATEGDARPSPAPLAPSAAVPPPLIEPKASPDELIVPSSPTPTGSHWSVGAHDDHDPFENTFSREVGSAGGSTNALVLPQMPVSDLSGPVTGTGEIIVTGMIEVPHIVTSTGTAPTIHDSADVDDYVEPGDVEISSAGAAPVSALRAVSGHTGSGSMIGSKPQRNTNTLTTVLVASTVVMAVVAIGLFVLAAVNGLF